MNYTGGYRSYDPIPYYRNRGWLIGNGSVGGKGKGIAFAHETLSEGELGEEVGLPEFTYAISTDVFEEFDSIHGLDSLATSGISFDDLQKRILNMDFPHSFRETMRELLEKIEVPLAVRSSSLLEDDIELSFAGKYATCFMSNRGTMEQRVEKLSDSIRKVYASVYHPAAIEYRKKHGVPHGIEKMAVLIQPLQGRCRGDMFYPELAVTAFSCVFRRPSPRVEKNDGVMRLCFGMGTHTVERSFARTFYFTNPFLRPEGTNPEQVYLYSQKEFDYIDLESGEFKTADLINNLSRVVKHHKMASAFIEWYDDGMLYWLNSSRSNMRLPRPCFTFSDLPRRCKNLFTRMSRLLAFFEGAMGFPVDVEAIYESECDMLRVVQLRPLASFIEFGNVEIPDDIPQEKIVLKGNRMVTNHVLKGITKMVYVDPDIYVTSGDYPAVARAVGEQNEALEGERYILVGPGRWGSSNPSLGVPIDYSEISNCGCMVEVGIPKRGMIPELSYGTHFFLDLDVDDILYLPVIEGQQDNIFSREWFDKKPFKEGGHPAVRVYEGVFDVYLDGEKELGVIFEVS